MYRGGVESGKSSKIGLKNTGATRGRAISGGAGGEGENSTKRGGGVEEGEGKREKSPGWLGAVVMVAGCIMSVFIFPALPPSFPYLSSLLPQPRLPFVRTLSTVNAAKLTPARRSEFKNRYKLYIYIYFETPLARTRSLHCIRGSGEERRIILTLSVTPLN